MAFEKIHELFSFAKAYRVKLRLTVNGLSLTHRLARHHIIRWSILKQCPLEDIQGLIVIYANRANSLTKNEKEF